MVQYREVEGRREVGQREQTQMGGVLWEIGDGTHVTNLSAAESYPHHSGIGR